jgi:hypothetical protein
LSTSIHYFLFTIVSIIAARTLSAISYYLSVTNIRIRVTARKNKLTSGRETCHT